MVAKAKSKRNQMKKIGHFCCMYLRDVRQQTHDDFKAECAKRGSNMKRELVNFMEEFVKKGKR